MQKRQSKNHKGIDVSHWQGTIDWQAVKKDGVSFAYIKATEGTTLVDPMFAKNFQGTQKAGIVRGFYHFARFNNATSALNEAHHFIQTIKVYTSELPHVLDLEVQQSIEKKTLSKLVLTFLNAVKKATSHEVMLYTNTYFAKNLLDASLSKVPLWIAEYEVDQPQNNDIWESWRVFQYTNKGKVKGITGWVDLNEMASAAASSAFSVKNSYIIKKGDTFWDLEKRHLWPHGTLEKLNPGIKATALQIGQKIKVPSH